MRTILILLAALTTSCAAIKSPAAKSPQRHQTSILRASLSKWYGESGNAFKSKTSPVAAHRMDVRVTAYWRGQDKWTNKGMSATGRRLISGKSAAVDFRLIKPNSTLSFFSNGFKKEFVAVDTGSAIKSRRASRKTGRNEPVIDIFFNTRSQAMSFLSTLPKNQIVQITVQNSLTKDAKATQ